MPKTYVLPVPEFESQLAPAELTEEERELVAQ